MRYTITPIRAYFTRCGYAVTLWHEDGTRYRRLLTVEGSRAEVMTDEPATFYGNDGRTVRAEAVRFAKAYGASLKDCR